MIGTIIEFLPKMLAYMLAVAILQAYLLVWIAIAVIEIWGWMQKREEEE